MIRAMEIKKKKKKVGMKGGEDAEKDMWELQF